MTEAKQRIAWDKANNTAESAGEKERLKLFRTDGDTFAILQIRNEEVERMAFRSTEDLEKEGITPKADHYRLIYTEPLPAFTDRKQFLERCFARFNIDRPLSFIGHSLSVSDIILIKKNDAIAAFYIEPAGFKKLPKFTDGSCYEGELKDGA